MKDDLDWFFLEKCQAQVLLSFVAFFRYIFRVGFAQIQTLPDLIRERLLPLVKTEEQLLYVFHLAGPFLQRLHTERLMRPLFDLTVQFYRMLQRVDRECAGKGGLKHLVRHILIPSRS